MSFRVVTGCTPGAYEEEAHQLEATCERMGLAWSEYRLENHGDWIKNCKGMALAAQWMIDACCADIVLMDADARIRKYPELFDRLECDVAFHIVRYPEKHQPCSGTVFFKNNENARRIIRRWIKLNAENTDWDDDNLWRAVKELQDSNVITGNAPIKFEELPEAYCRIHGNRIQSSRCADAYVWHTQASRRLKDAIDKR
jgi:hypothetical protein